jgi:hypothetical protein
MLQRYEAPDSESSASRKKRRTQSPTSSSDSSSGRSSSSTSAESVEEMQTGGLLLSQLVSMSEGADGDQSLYAQQAKNPERVKGVLKESCCKASCKKKDPFQFCDEDGYIFLGPAESISRLRFVGNTASF